MHERSIYLFNQTGRNKSYWTTLGSSMHLDGIKAHLHLNFVLSFPFTLTESIRIVFVFYLLLSWKMKDGFFEDIYVDTIQQWSFPLGSNYISSICGAANTSQELEGEFWLKLLILADRFPTLHLVSLNQVRVKIIPVIVFLCISLLSPLLLKTIKALWFPEALDIPEALYMIFVSSQLFARRKALGHRILIE